MRPKPQIDATKIKSEFVTCYVCGFDCKWTDGAIGPSAFKGRVRFICTSCKKKRDEK